MPWPVLLMARELDLGGSERQMALLARALDRSIFTPIVGCFRPAGLRGHELQAAGVPIVHFPVYSFASAGSMNGAWKLARFVRSRGIRLVHTFDYPLTVFAIPVTRLLTNAIALSSQRSHRDLIPSPYRTLVQWTDRLASGLVVNCQYVRRHLEQDEHVATSRIRLCYNGIDILEFSPDGPDRGGSPSGRSLVIGTICALRPEKALQDLLNAFARLRETRPQPSLIIIGSGPERDALESLAGALGILDRCTFAPAVQDVSTALRGIDIFVLPSRSEALSNSLMEAMACGCCAVASNVGGNPELIRDGETGLLFETAGVAALVGALESLIANVTLRQRLAAAGSAWVRGNFSIRSSAQRMGEIYAELIERRARAAPG